MTGRIETVAVVGRDLALWLTASVLRMALRPAVIEVHAVELPTHLSPADCYTTLPQLDALHRQLRIDEGALIRMTGGAFTLGQRFAETRTASAIFHAYGSAGTGIDGTDFFGHWLKARQFGLNVGLDDFSLAAAAAKQGRLFIPDDDSDLYGTSDYGYHLPALAYAGLLKACAIGAGVHLHEARTARPILSSDGSRIDAVELDSGLLIKADVFVDATGADGELVSALGVQRRSWREAFAGDRLLAAVAPALSPTPVYAEIRATEHGWTGLFPVQDWTHVLHLFAADDRDDEQALSDASEASGTALSSVRVRSLEQGIRERLWVGNCVAVGPAACMFDPVHGVDVHGLQLGLVHLLSCFPVGRACDAQAAEYDRITRSTLEKLRDFQSAYFALNAYNGSFWDRARSSAQSPELRHRIATFAARGEIAPSEDDSFSPDSWRALFLGHGVTPETYPPAVDRTDPERLKSEFRRMLGFVKEQVLRQPLHGDYLDRLKRGEHV